MFEAFQIGPVTVWMRVVFLLLGAWLGVEFFIRLSMSAGLSLRSIRDHAKWHVLSFLLFGRLFAVIGNYQTYVKQWWQIFLFWDGGFSFIGAAIGVALVLFWSAPQQRATFLQWLDVLLPATTFALAFDWLGLFLSAQAYGKPTDVPWGIVMDSFSVRYTVPIHPVQLYYAAFFLLLTFVLLLVRRHSERAGAETLFGIVIAALGVFLFEFLRGDFGIPVFAILTDFIFLGCLFVSLGILALIEQRITERANTAYSVAVAILTIGYVLSRQWLALPQYQLRFSQVLSILALLAAVIYVVVHRRKYPHL